MSLLNRLFRWRSRVKTGAPDLHGSVETLSSHVSDENAHPSYLKKGQAVPTGQEANAIAQHRSDQLAHARHFARRPELITTLEEYNAAKNYDFVNDVNNYSRRTGVAPHVVTAFILRQVIEASKAEGVVPSNTGDGKQLLYSDSNGVIKVSTSSVGNANNPVYLLNGTLTPTNPVMTLAGNQTVTGRKTFSTLPQSNAVPTFDTDFVTKQYVDGRQSELPVGFCITTDKTVASAADVHTKIGYGTWELFSEVGTVGYMWKRIG